MKIKKEKHDKVLKGSQTKEIRELQKKKKKKDSRKKMSENRPAKGNE